METTMSKKSNGPLQIDISPDQFTVHVDPGNHNRGHKVHRSVRYAEGMFLTAGEANALNQTYLRTAEIIYLVGRRKGH